MKNKISKNVKKIIAMSLMCSVLLCNVDASAATVSLKKYNGNVVASFTNRNYEGAYNGAVHLFGGVKKNLNARIEAYYFDNASDRNKRKNVRFYDKSYSYYGSNIGVGGHTVTYPLCNSGYPCQVFAAVNGVFQGKAVIPE